MVKVGMIIVWVMLFGISCFGNDPLKEILKDSVISECDSLVQKLGFNKDIPEQLTIQFFAALEHYPEFDSTKIKVKYRNIKTTMLCRPRIDFILKKRENRVYKILVDTRKKKNCGVLFEELPFNAQIGVFGHELAHVFDYNTKRNCEVIVFGIEYLFPAKRRVCELNVDMIAINHGLGYQIRDFSKYVFEESQASPEYIKYKKRFYFQPRQIKRILTTSPLYFPLN